MGQRSYHRNDFTCDRCEQHTYTEYQNASGAVSKPEGWYRLEMEADSGTNRTPGSIVVLLCPGCARHVLSVIEPQAKPA